MIDILIIQHESDTPPGTVVDWAIENNLSYKIFKIYESQSLGFGDEFRALVICGGTMDTFEEDRYPWLRPEKDFIKVCIEQKKPIFGLCLGSQLLAEVLGGRVFPFGKWEIGFVPVRLTDPFTGKRLNILDVFHWHQCTFELPQGAQLIGTNDFCKNQAFIFGDRIVATQFHPEASRDWILQCAQGLIKKSYSGVVQSKEDICANIEKQVALQEWFFEILSNWFKKAI